MPRISCVQNQESGWRSAATKAIVGPRPKITPVAAGRPRYRKLTPLTGRPIRSRLVRSRFDRHPQMNSKYGVNDSRGRGSRKAIDEPRMLPASRPPERRPIRRPSIPPKCKKRKPPANLHDAALGPSRGVWVTDFGFRWIAGAPLRLLRYCQNGHGRGRSPHRPPCQPQPNRRPRARGAWLRSDCDSAWGPDAGRRHNPLI
jgi:hypothetical protein